MGGNKVQSIQLILGGDRSAVGELKEGESMMLGRDPSCDFQINHSSISPIHCKINFEGGILTVTDLESKEGLYFKNRKARRVELIDDAVFVVGEVVVTTRRGFATARATAPKRRKLLAGLRPGKSFLSHPPIHREDDGHQYRKSLENAVRKIPFIGFSLLLHFIILLLIADLPFVSRKVFEVKQILAKIMNSNDEVLLDVPDPVKEKLFENPDPLDYEFYEPLDPQSVRNEEPLDPIVQDQGMIAISGTGSIRNTPGLAGEGTAELRSLLDNGFRNYINGLRETGMDVAFIIDSTSSMVPFIGEAKRVVDTLISRLAAIVPDLRLAIVTYRDKDDEYVTQHLELTSDRYEILNFLEDCQAGGGGDFPEAIYEALRRGIDTLLWRKQARKVIIIIGDAPCHEEDEQRIDRLLRTFRKSENPGVVSTVYIGPVTNPPTQNQKSAVECLKHIAQTAGGEFSWISENDKMILHLANIAVGSRWEKNVDRLLHSVKKDRMARLVERKVRTGERRWLLEGLKRVPVRAGIVDALIASPEPRDLGVLAGYLESDTVPPETKWAALYILRKVLKRSLTYNPNSTPDMQRKELLYIEKALSDFNQQSKD